MCGIAGFLNLDPRQPADARILDRMASRLVHRGPDSYGAFVCGPVALGFRRLAILDRDAGDQPVFNEDRRVVSVCNGEIYNYATLAHALRQRGHLLRSRCDTEILPHLYEEHGADCVDHLSGQFAYALYDHRAHELFLTRDRFGINPLMYARTSEALVFASEIKAILEHPSVRREVNLQGLDQVLCFPGLISPTTMFQGIESLRAGHQIRMRPDGTLCDREYWDLRYPVETVDNGGSDGEYAEQFRDHLRRAVRRCLQSDVPVGLYLSGGLDSSLVGALMREGGADGDLRSFSIAFHDQAMNEAAHQRIAARHLGSAHREILVSEMDVIDNLTRATYHAECPFKDTYNAASLTLSGAARASAVPVVLTGQGADELFAGYIGYRFDEYQAPKTAAAADPEEIALRNMLWADASTAYEGHYAARRDLKRKLYSAPLAARLHEFECFNAPIVAPGKLAGLHGMHKRSYLDVKLRLCDHLLADHGDRMAMANSIELRHPFLDVDVAEFATRLPPAWKLRHFEEKYVVKQAARTFVPAPIVEREKFGWFAPGTPALLHANPEWLEDRVSYARIAREGYFNPDTVETLKATYRQPGFALDQPFETDLLAIVLTFGILLQEYRLPFA